MTANFKAYRAACQLECGHVVLFKVEYPLRVPPDYIHCNLCSAEVALYAVECREWRVKCSQCRYTRWCGQSERTARELQAKHFVSRSHQTSVQYTMEPSKFEIVKGHYKRKLQYRILGTPRIPIVRRRNTTPDIPPF